MLKFSQIMKDVELPGTALKLAGARKGRALSALFGSAAFLALALVMPANAQGVPADLLRLDPVVSSDNRRQLAEISQARLKARSAFAHDRRNRHQPLARSPD
jgi:hypothetical protein